MRFTLAQLRKLSLPYRYEEELDLSVFLNIIKKLGIDTDMLCGGAQINALFLQQD